MKLRLLPIVAVLAGTATFLSAQGRTQNTVTIQAFNFENAADWKYEVSRYVRVTNGVTNALLKTYAVKPVGLGPLDSFSSNSMAIRATWLRKGFNWIDIIPAKEVPAYEGQVKMFDMWVWGGNFNYNLEVLVADYEGFQYTLPFGNLQYFGWKNLSVEIPTVIPQTIKTFPRNRGLRFLKFRINTNPGERVEDFLAVFDYFKVTTDMFRPPFDGSDVENIVNSDTSAAKPAGN